MSDESQERIDDSQDSQERHHESHEPARGEHPAKAHHTIVIKRRRRVNGWMIATIILALAVIVLAALLVMPGLKVNKEAPKNNTAQQNNITQSNNTLSQNLLATVNGDSIYMDDVLAIYNSIPAAQRTNISMQESFDQAISNRLLIQDAAKKGLTATEEEIDNAISSYLSSSGLTMQQLEQNLTNTGSSTQKLRTGMKNSLILQKEVAAITGSVAAPTEQAIQAYYDQNKQNLFSKAKADTKQLLIYANDSNVNEKLEQIKSIAALMNATNFCELVTKYSEDTTSVPRCGEYNFTQGELLPEYEQAVFNSTPGDAKILRTRIGLHIVEILNVTQARQLTYDEVKANIGNYLLLLSKQTALDQYISTLRSQAQIVSYLNK
jgi:parvulin-like peptidyl-prolyl isomerase